MCVYLVDYLIQVSDLSTTAAHREVCCKAATGDVAWQWWLFVAGEWLTVDARVAGKLRLGRSWQGQRDIWLPTVIGTRPQTLKLISLSKSNDGR